MIERILDLETTSTTLNQWSDLIPYLDDLETLEKLGLRLLVADKATDVDNEMIVVFAPAYGFNLDLLDEGLTLCDPTLCTEIVTYTHFGSQYRESRQCLVSRELMLEAARYYFDTGCPAPHLSWIATR